MERKFWHLCHRLTAKWKFRRSVPWKERIENASMTVEASVIVPMIVIITAALIILTFFVHNKNYYMAAGYEAALVGNAWYSPEEDPDGSVSQQAARDRVETRIEGQPFPGTSPDPEVSFEGNVTKVSFSGQRFSMFSDMFDWSVDVQAERVKPVRAIRSARVIKKTVEGLKETED